jgi:hypothetical protein
MDFRSGRPRSRQADRRPSALAVIHWKHADGTEAEGHPLPRPHAEALLRAFETQFPVPTFWLEDPPLQDDDSSDS